ncbi:fungus-induced protein 1-like [Colias croceus]|uniref:fungus-induced protein 1-like n=1 Tax=Colias crocea TaxID=72248 RepID=UPI001E27FBE9|nr:fungus-induced protein 1-like [Colias croceus]
MKSLLIFACLMVALGFAQGYLYSRPYYSGYGQYPSYGYGSGYGGGYGNGYGSYGTYRPYYSRGYYGGYPGRNLYSYY